MTTESDVTATAGGAPPPRWVLKTMTRLHVFLHRLTGGRLFNRLADYEVCFVTMKGAKSERILTVPLMYIPYRNGVLLVASQGGAPKNPAWYHNLVKYSDIVVSHRGHRMKLRAHLAMADEKPDLWPICDQHYAPYAEYRKRTTRDIPIFICEPAALSEISNEPKMGKSSMPMFARGCSEPFARGIGARRRPTHSARSAPVQGR